MSTMLTAEKNRLSRAVPEGHPCIQRYIAWFKQVHNNLDADLSDQIRQSSVRREKDDPLCSVPGVGQQVSLTLLSGVSELGALSRKQIAFPVGVAPLSRDSGPHCDRRTVSGGRAEVRATLDMGALVATRCNPIMRKFYLRLVAVGKPQKVALTACMRKLLTILNTMVKNDECRDPTATSYRLWRPLLRLSRPLLFKHFLIERLPFPVKAIQVDGGRKAQAGREATAGNRVSNSWCCRSDHPRSTETWNEPNAPTLRSFTNPSMATRY